MHGWLRKRHIAAELGLVDELAHPKASRTHQPTEIGQRADRCKILQITLEISADVAIEPDTPIRCVGELQRRRRETSALGKRAPILGTVLLGSQQFPPFGIGRSEQLFPSTTLSKAMLLAPGHRPERQVAC